MITNLSLNVAHGHLSFTVRLTVMPASGSSAMSISSEPLFSETETDLVVQGQDQGKGKSTEAIVAS